MRPSRRDVLRWGAVLMGGAACAPDPATFDLGEPSLGCTVSPLDAEKAGVLLGQAAREAGVTGAEADAVVDAFGDDLDALLAQHLEDLERDRVLYVDGWVLSVTEARWYASMDAVG